MNPINEAVGELHTSEIAQNFLENKKKMLGRMLSVVGYPLSGAFVGVLGYPMLTKTLNSNALIAGGVLASVGLAVGVSKLYGALKEMREQGAALDAALSVPTRSEESRYAQALLEGAGRLDAPMHLPILTDANEGLRMRHEPHIQLQLKNSEVAFFKEEGARHFNPQELLQVYMYQEGLALDRPTIVQAVRSLDIQRGKQEFAHLSDDDIVFRTKAMRQAAEPLCEREDSSMACQRVRALHAGAQALEKTESGLSDMSRRLQERREQRESQVMENPASRGFCAP